MKFTILLVEYSRVQKLANEKLLTQAGYLVLLAESGEDAVRLAVEARPDMVLLDMILPRLSGSEVLQALKRDRATAGVPVIVLSELSKGDEAKARYGGAAGYFAKSKLANGVDGEAELVELIKKTLRESPRNGMPAAHVGG